MCLQDVALQPSRASVYITFHKNGGRDKTVAGVSNGMRPMKFAPSNPLFESVKLFSHHMSVTALR